MGEHIVPVSDLTAFEREVIIEALRDFGDHTTNGLGTTASGAQRARKIVTARDLALRLA